MAHAPRSDPEVDFPELLCNFLPRDEAAIDGRTAMLSTVEAEAPTLRLRSPLRPRGYLETLQRLLQ